MSRGGDFSLQDFFGAMLGRVSQGVRPDDEITRYYARLVQRVAMHALNEWSAISAARIPCQMLEEQPSGAKVACRHVAGGSCMVCRHLVCLDHAMISPTNGSLVCMACLQGFTTASDRTATPPNDPANGPQKRSARRKRKQSNDTSHGAKKNGFHDVQLTMHLGVLGLAPPSSVQEVKKAFRARSAKVHPDRFSQASPSERARAETIYKQLSQSYHWLLEHYENAPRAASGGAP